MIVMSQHVEVEVRHGKVTDSMEEEIKELEEDVRDCEKSFNQAQEELEDAHEWVDKQKLHLAEAIIRLHNKKYGK
jgi:F0F1-type ATP synthase epsilon subunit